MFLNNNENFCVIIRLHWEPWKKIYLPLKSSSDISNKPWPKSRLLSHLNKPISIGITPLVRENKKPANENQQKITVVFHFVLVKLAN